MNNNFATIHIQDLEYISKCILDFPDIETGGDFFGFWNNLGMPVILYVTGPGKNCWRSSSFFKQDLEFLISVGKEIFSRFGIQHIGSWHSHHKLSLAVPSSHDCSTMVKAINNNNLEKFFMILGNITNKGGTTVNGFLFDKKNQTIYKETVWNVLMSENIISKAIDKNLEPALLYIPKTKKSKLQDLKLLPKNKKVISTIEFKQELWLGTEKGRNELKEVVNWLQKTYIRDEIQNEVKIFIKENQDVELLLKDCCEIRITFPSNFPISKPIITRECVGIYQDEDKTFEFLNSIDIIKYLEKNISSYSVCTQI